MEYEYDTDNYPHALILTPEQRSRMRSGNPDRIRQLALSGLEDAGIAAALGVDIAVFNTWVRDDVQIKEALDDGRVMASARVAEAMYKCAVGLAETEEVIIKADGEIQRKVTRHKPDTKAQLDWLKNRASNQWADRVEVSTDHTIDISHVLEASYSARLRNIKKESSSD